MPFTAAIGAHQAATAGGEIASEGARRGAGMGAVVGSAVGLAGFGVAALAAQPPPSRTAHASPSAWQPWSASSAATSVGAAIGAVVGNEARRP